MINQNSHRILFINPPYLRFFKQGIPTYPITFGPMATLLEQKNYNVRIYDADYDRNFLGRQYTYLHRLKHSDKFEKALKNDTHPVWQEIRQVIIEFRPEIIGITAMTNKFPAVAKIAQIIKSISPNIHVLVGGFHATIFGAQLLENHDFDYILSGEGEITVTELVEFLSGNGRKQRGEIPGILYRTENGIINTGPRGLMADLDELPLPNFKLFLNENYIPGNNLLISRGCPFSCSYCGAKAVWSNHVRRMSIPRVISELEYLLAHGSSRHVTFWDDSFTCNRKYTLELMAALKKFKSLRFSCITRLDLIDEELLVEMQQSGCEQIYFGIEFGNDKMLKIVGKKLTTVQIQKQLELLEKVKILWAGFFMMGYPHEERQDILDTVNFMKKIRPSYAEINVFNPLPGTPIWDELIQNGIIEANIDFAHYSQASLNKCFVEGMKPREFRNLALHVAKEFDRYNAASARISLYRRIRLLIGKLQIRTRLRKYLSVNKRGTL